MAETELTVLRVFVAEDGEGGNPLGVFLDGAAVPADRRQDVAADLGFSETVFVDDAQDGTVRIFTPIVELPFAGHPLVGTSWLLAQEGKAVEALRPPVGEVETWEQGELTFIRARPEWATEYELVQVADAKAVDEHPLPDDRDAMVEVWAWEDEWAGRVRARVFPRGIGIDEDEATGAAAVRFAAHVGRPVSIRQGTGSVLAARPGPGGTAEVGGRCALVERRSYAPG